MIFINRILKAPDQKNKTKSFLLSEKDKTESLAGIDLPSMIGLMILIVLSILTTYYMTNKSIKANSLTNKPFGSNYARAKIICKKYIPRINNNSFSREEQYILTYSNTNLEAFTIDDGILFSKVKLGDSVLVFYNIDEYSKQPIFTDVVPLGTEKKDLF